MRFSLFLCLHLMHSEPPHHPSHIRYVPRIPCSMLCSVLLLFCICLLTIHGKHSDSCRRSRSLRIRYWYASRSHAGWRHSVPRAYLPLQKHICDIPENSDKHYDADQNDAVCLHNRYSLLPDIFWPSIQEVLLWKWQIQYHNFLPKASLRSYPVPQSCIHALRAESLPRRIHWS